MSPKFGGLRYFVGPWGVGTTKYRSSSLDPKLLHSTAKRIRVHVQKTSRALWTFDDPACPEQGGGNVLAFHVLERSRSSVSSYARLRRVWRRHSRQCRQLIRADVPHTASRQNERPLRDASQGFVFSVERNGTPPARRTSNRLLHRLTNSGLSLRLGQHDAIEAQQLAD